MKTFLPVLLFLAATLNGCQKKSLPVSVPELPLMPVIKPVVTEVDDQIGGYYQAVSPQYENTPTPTPVMIFIHGAGQFGNGKNDLPMLLQEGITQLLDEHRIPDSFSSKGMSYSMLYFSPQFKSQFLVESLDHFIQFIVRNYKVDTTRIYIAGMSRGGELACKYAAAYPGVVTAVVSMGGGVAESDREMVAETIASHNVPIWAIHNTGDEIIPYTNSEGLINLIHSKNPNSASTLTPMQPEGPLNHDCWTRSTDPSFRINNMNIYEWVLQFRR